MRILIVGSGGREHALAWALARSPEAPELFVAPGNPGTEGLGTNVPLAADDVEGLRAFAEREGIDLTIVGPERPLVAGIVDAFEAADLPVVGPSKAAARLEGSKAFAKAFMARHGIPTAAHRTFEAEEYEAARAYLDRRGAPIVVKASGLAGGKGAFVCRTLKDAHDALRSIMQERDLGAAGEHVVIEACMRGEEVSVFALTDGSDYVLLAPAQDHKRIGEGDTGPNTGGMGAYAPAPVVTEALLERIRHEVVEPTLAGMAEEGAPYRGVLYCGLMITEDGPQVVEYNCRLGDPEAQVVLPLLADDPVDLFRCLAHRELAGAPAATPGEAAACIVLASEGYPASYETGFPITGISEAEAVRGVTVFQAGTAHNGDEQLVTDGGRVLGVTATGPTLERALERAYVAADAIHFEGKTLRRDIGRKGLAHLP